MPDYEPVGQAWGREPFHFYAPAHATDRPCLVESPFDAPHPLPPIVDALVHASSRTYWSASNARLQWSEQK